MAIHAGGCIYVGNDGKRRDIDISAAAASPGGFKNLMDSLGAGVPGQSRARRNAPVMPPLPGIGNAHVPHGGSGAPMPGSAIVDTQQGLALRGEEGNPLVEGKKVYSSVDGRKGYHTLDEIDPVPGGGRRVGPPQTTDDPEEDGDSVDGFDGKGVTVPSLTRLHFEQVGRVCTLKQFESERAYSPGRRLANVSPETSREVATWLAGGDEGEDVAFPYEVRDFGTERAPMMAIHLPSNILMVAGAYVNVSEGMQRYDAGDGNDWFVLPVTDGEVYMKVTMGYYSDALDDAEAGDLNTNHFDRKENVFVNVNFTNTPDNTDGTTHECSCWIEICNIVGGEIFQKVNGALVLHGPPCEIVGSKLVGTDEFELMRIIRSNDGCTSLSAPIKIVGSGGITVTHSGGGLQGANVFTVSGDGGGGGAGYDPTPSVRLDQKSIDRTAASTDSQTGEQSGGEIEMKGWKVADNATGMSVAQRLLGDSANATNGVVVRETKDGTLLYVPFGKIEAASGSGLTIAAKTGSSSDVVVDIVGRGGNSFSVCTLTKPDGTSVKYLATGDAAIPAQQPPTGKQVSVVTGISFAFDQNDQLVATITKRNVTVLDDGTESTGPVTIPLFKNNVVTTSTYDTTSHKFTNIIRPGVVTDTSSQPTTDTVFTSTAHSAE